MSNCICPLAGYCQRHNVNKSEHWHQLCQTRDDYFLTWEEGHGPGQSSKPKEQYERRLRVIENVNRNKRLRGWVMSMRTAGEAGIGDTLVRLIKLAGTREVKKDLQCMQRQCLCSKLEATKKLNQDYPY